METVEERAKLATQSILENEQLTAKLDDASAKALLNWATATIKVIAQDTTGLDDEEAEEAMYPRLRALRNLMKYVNQWLSSLSKMDNLANVEMLDNIIEQANTIYGQHYISPSPTEQGHFLKQSLNPANPPTQIIADLRTLIDKLAADSNQPNVNRPTTAINPPPALAKVEEVSVPTPPDKTPIASSITKDNVSQENKPISPVEPVEKTPPLPNTPPNTTIKEANTPNIEENVIPEDNNKDSGLFGKIWQTIKKILPI